MESEEIAFRRLAEADLPLMHRWLSNDHVAEWYPIDDISSPPLELVRRHYLPMIGGDEPTHGFVISLNGNPAGFIQAYMIDDHPDYSRAVQAGPGAAGVDLFIGEKDSVHRGLGPRILDSFLKQVVFGHLRATACIIGPQPGNRAAIRAYEKAGFKHLKTVYVPTSPGDGQEYLMVMEKPNE